MASLYPFQAKAAQQVLAAPLHRWILSFETGLGKSATSIAVLRDRGVKRALIVCPAVVRRGWLNELDTWWPAHPEAKAISLGRGRQKNLSKPALERKAACFTAPIQVVSYDLAADVDLAGWDAIVIDELHKLKGAHTAQSKAVRAICRANPRAAIIGLTATPMPDRPLDIWNQCDTIWPGRFGMLDKNGRGCFKFKDRYANRKLKTWPGGQAWDFEGINELYADELRRRITAISTRVTKAEAAPYLPPLIVRALRVRPDSGGFGRPTDEAGMEGVLLKMGEHKLAPALEWAEDTLESARKVVIFTHLRSTAEALYQKVGRSTKVSTFCITGDMPPDQRMDVVARFQAAPAAVLCATMHSVGIGVNGLDCATDVLFAELYYRPETLIQALGRFNRLSTKEPTTISLLVLEGTVDEVMVVHLQRKIADINNVIQAGYGEDALESSFSADVDDRLFRDIATSDIDASSYFD